MALAATLVCEFFPFTPWSLKQATNECISNSELGKENGPWEPLPSSSNPGFLADRSPSSSEIPGVGSLSRASEVPCTILGRTFREIESSAETCDNFNITEQLLYNLMGSFPQGHIFHLSDTDSQESPTQPSDLAAGVPRQLSMLFPGATSVIFSPIWDWNKSRWSAGTLVWTSDITRALDAEELHYLQAFGDSIISEVTRFDWSNTQGSKSAFLSSVSHELRSPLHGILASAELLRGSSLPTEQRRLVGMVESCGLTLLDTMNHVYVISPSLFVQIP